MKITNMIEFIKSLNNHQLHFLLEESGTVDILDKELIYLTCEVIKSQRSEKGKALTNSIKQ